MERNPAFMEILGLHGTAGAMDPGWTFVPHLAYMLHAWAFFTFSSQEHQLEGEPPHKEARAPPHQVQWRLCSRHIHYHFRSRQ